MPGLREATKLSPGLRNEPLRLKVQSGPTEVTLHFIPQQKYQITGFRSLENALRDALKSVLEKDGRSDPRTSFYHKFKEVAEQDEGLHQKYDGDLNTTLVFVSSSFAPLVEPAWLMH